jgi:KaiC/GvpD/RAD55 family RecA-like ATPase
MKKEKTTQDFIELESVKNSIMVMKDKSLRGVLMVSSTNFALKSSEEQESVIHQFQGFLNSLDFTCQIVCQSRKLNITGYIEKVEDLYKNQKNPLLKKQTLDYKKFIEETIENQDILIKSFFVVIPYESFEITGLTVPGKKDAKELTDNVFYRSRDQLFQRMEFIALGLRRCGLKAVPLTSIELIEFFWELYHPSEAEVGYYPEIPEELID